MAQPEKPLRECTTAKDAFDHYVAMAYHGPLVPVQRKEVTRAFAAGLAFAIAKVTMIASGDDEEASMAAVVALQMSGIDLANSTMDPMQDDPMIQHPEM